MEAPASSYATAVVALRIHWARKPHHYVKVGIPSAGTSPLLTLQNVTSVRGTVKGDNERQTGRMLDFWPTFLKKESEAYKSIILSVCQSYIPVSLYVNVSPNNSWTN
jgi:hypothetical protein